MCIIAFHDALVGLYDAFIHTCIEDQVYSDYNDNNKIINNTITLSNIIYRVVVSIDMLGDRVYKVLKCWHLISVSNTILLDGSVTNVCTGRLWMSFLNVL